MSRLAFHRKELDEWNIAFSIWNSLWFSFFMVFLEKLKNKPMEIYLLYHHGNHLITKFSVNGI